MELSVWILLLFAVLLCLLLFSPFTFEVILLRGQKEFSLTWTFLKYGYNYRQKKGAIRIGFIRINFRGKEKAPAKKEKPKAPDKEKKKVPAALLFAHRGTLLKLLRESIVALFRIVCSLELRQASLKIVYGTEDPATTGMLYGLYSTLPRNLLPVNMKFEVSPDFEEQTFRSSMELEIQCRLYKLIWTMTLLLWAIPKIQTIKLLIDLKKKRGVYAKSS